MKRPEQTGSVGVVIAAYRAADTIGAAVASALAEPEVGQVVVVDDASGDDTPAAALAADDGSGRLTVLRQAVNQGPACARNRALAVLTTPWVCVLDSDDYFLPGRTARLLALTEGQDLVADALIKVTSGAAPPALSTTTQAEQINLEAFVRGNVSRQGRDRQELGFIKPLMRMAFLRRHALTYDDSLRLGEDYAFYAAALAHGAQLLLTGPQGYVAVTRPDSLSGRHSEEDLRRLRDCDRDIAAVRPLSRAESAALDAHAVSVDQRLQWRLLINAVKARDPAAMAATVTSWPVARFLAARLIEQLWLRTLGRVKRAPEPAALPLRPEPKARS
ncbi:glycosyltransferase [Caulobacter segnis]|uniref:glycosyltransferase family 2 protein n=1 Tax=Caulobacter segnis TaxID=88688 RepID=UPI0024106188|nr:glycosyltransferase [Caulobacter segnis]MDG2520299.1 glycosyltransferase [Caulobacter segnis]